MTPDYIRCPKCCGSAFSAVLRAGTGGDTHCYLELRCTFCYLAALAEMARAGSFNVPAVKRLEFVVDMTPTFDVIETLEWLTPETES